MELITEYSDQIRWFSAILIYPIALFLMPGKVDNDYKIRRFLYLTALPLFCIDYGLGSVVTNNYIGADQSAIIVFKIVISIVRAIVITEVIRSLIKDGVLWSIKKHIIVLVTLAMLLAATNIAAQ